MNSDFPRIVTLLRKERHISQKKAATDLGVSQSLLSHYEKGIRECGLEFLIKVADYYSVSCDYLLGRSAEPEGKTIVIENSEDNPSQKEHFSAGGMMVAFNKKLITNAINVLFSLMQKCKSDTLEKEVSSFLMLAVYRMFRITYCGNPKNDQGFFAIPEIIAKSTASAAMELSEANALAAAKGVKLGANDCVNQVECPIITAATLSEEFSSNASSMLNVVKNSEAKIQMLNNYQK
ncbi:MAG: helix-turn-helix domain-containing protein [Oscillospiraceae bacterium]